MVRFGTAIGDCGLAWSDRGLTDVWLPRDPAIAAAPRIEDRTVPEFARAAAAGIRALFDGERVDLREIPLDDATLDDFPRRVLAATRAIDPGDTTTYGEIARSSERRTTRAPWGRRSAATAGRS